MKSKKLLAIDADELLKDAGWIKKITKRAGLALETAQVLVGARLKMGVTQKQLAEKIGTTQSVIARAESGRSMLGLSFIDRVATAYGTNARIVFESMPDVVPVSVRYAHLNKPDTSNVHGDSTSIVNLLLKNMLSDVCVASTDASQRILETTR